MRCLDSIIDMICANPNCNKVITGYGVKYCSRSCSATVNNHAYPKRKSSLSTPCVVCGAKCKYRTCSITCNQTYRYHQYIDDWKNNREAGGTDKGVSAYVRRYLIETRGEQCEICGWCEVHPLTGRVPLDVHHVQSNDNHSGDNLQLLCPNHHALTATYRALNKGHGRAYRRQERNR